MFLPIIVLIYVSHQYFCLYEKHEVADLKHENRFNGWLQHDSSFNLKQLFTNLKYQDGYLVLLSEICISTMSVLTFEHLSRNKLMIEKHN
jgi:hypothetical protein